MNSEALPEQVTGSATYPLSLMLNLTNLNKFFTVDCSSYTVLFFKKQKLLSWSDKVILKRNKCLQFFLSFFWYSEILKSTLWAWAQNRGFLLNPTIFRKQEISTLRGHIPDDMWENHGPDHSFSTKSTPEQQNFYNRKHNYFTFFLYNQTIRIYVQLYS